MKLASRNDGTRDGELMVVSRDLARCTSAATIVPTLQAALDNWHRVVPALQAMFADLQSGDVSGQPFDQATVHSPLPRAFQWADGSAYVNHVQLVRQARGAEMPESFWTDPLMYQGGSDDFLPPHAPIAHPFCLLILWPRRTVSSNVLVPIFRGFSSSSHLQPK